MADTTRQLLSKALSTVLAVALTGCLGLTTWSVSMAFEHDARITVIERTHWTAKDAYKAQSEMMERLDSSLNSIESMVHELAVDVAAHHGRQD